MPIISIAEGQNLRKREVRIISEDKVSWQVLVKDVGKDQAAELSKHRTHEFRKKDV